MRLFESELNLRPLRGKQIPLIDLIAAAARRGKKRIMVQAPTGFGKTVVAAHLMARSAAKGRRPLFVCPAIALVEQTLRSFEAQGISDIGVIQAQHERTDWTAQVQIASRDTLVRRNLPEVHFVIVDEGHDQREALNTSLRSEAWKNIIVVFFSATPWSKGLGLVCDELIIATTTEEMIADGWLSPFIVYVPDRTPDMSKVKITAGDYNEKQSALVMSDKQVVGDAVELWLKHRQSGEHPGDRTFLYGVDRAHAKRLMEAFNAAGVRCGYIDGESTEWERARTFQSYRERTDKVLANVGVLITGVDEDVRCIQDCAPTKSQIRHVQKIGRGLRLAEGKEHLLILDNAGNHTRKGLGMVTDIHHDTLDTRAPGDSGDGYADEQEPPQPRKCRMCNALIPPQSRKCPKCGAEKPPADSRVEEVAGTLTKLQPKEKFSMDQKQTWYSQFLGIAQDRGKSDGWAAHLYKDKFGVWPNQLLKVPAMPERAVLSFEKHRRIAFAKSKEAELKRTPKSIDEAMAYTGEF